MAGASEYWDDPQAELRGRTSFQVAAEEMLDRLQGGGAFGPGAGIAGFMKPHNLAQFTNVLSEARGLRDPMVLSHFRDIAMRMPEKFQRGLRSIVPKEKALGEMQQYLTPQQTQKVIPQLERAHGFYEPFKQRIGLNPEIMDKTTILHEGFHKYMDTIRRKMDTGEKLTPSEERAKKMYGELGGWMREHPEAVEKTSQLTHTVVNNPEEFAAQSLAELLASGKYYKTFAELPENIQHMMKELRRLVR
jgi:hypothetical protein